MTYDAVSAYTVLFGDGEAPAAVSVHGSAAAAWQALDALVHAHEPRRARWRGRGRGAITEAEATESAERWRGADPERRYWQVAPHRLRVTVPAIAASRS